MSRKRRTKADIEELKRHMRRLCYMHYPLTVRNIDRINLARRKEDIVRLKAKANLKESGEKCGKGLANLPNPSLPPHRFHSAIGQSHHADLFD